MLTASGPSATPSSMRPRRVVGDGLAVLHVHEHVGGLVLDALVRADGPAEGLADLRVLDRHVEHLLGARRTSRRRGRRWRGRARGASGAQPAPAWPEQRVGADRDVRERHLAELARLVHRGQQRRPRPRACPLGTRKSEMPARRPPPGPRARGHHDGVGGVGVVDEELGAVERVAAALLRRGERDAPGAERRARLHPGEGRRACRPRRSSAATPSSAPRCPPRGWPVRRAGRSRSTARAPPRGPSPP